MAENQVELQESSPGDSGVKDTSDMVMPNMNNQKSESLSDGMWETNLEGRKSTEGGNDAAAKSAPSYAVMATIDQPIGNGVGTAGTALSNNNMNVDSDNEKQNRRKVGSHSVSADTSLNKLEVKGIEAMIAEELKSQLENQTDSKRNESQDYSLKTKLIFILIGIFLLFNTVCNIYLLIGYNNNHCECSNESSTEASSLSTNGLTTTAIPTLIPSNLPSSGPSSSPSIDPSKTPTMAPSNVPSMSPSNLPTSKPSDIPSVVPSNSPSVQPTAVPTYVPTSLPSTVPTSLPTVGVGQFVQIQKTISNSQTGTGTNTSWHEINTDYRLTITPKFTDSIIVVTYEFMYNGYGIAENTMVLWSAASAIGSDVNTTTELSRTTISTIGDTILARNRILGTVQRRNNGYDYNDPNSVHFSIIDQPNTTESVTYGLHFKIESSGVGPIRVTTSESNDASFAWSMPFIIYAIEYKNPE